MIPSSTAQPLIVALLVGVFFVLPISTWTASAADNFWTGAADDNWHNVANWQFQGPITPLPRVPSSIDTAILSNPTGETVRLTASAGQIQGLILSNGAGFANDRRSIRVSDGGAGGTAITGGSIVGLTGDTGPLSFLTVEFRSDTLLMTTNSLLLLGDTSRAVIAENATLASGAILGNDFSTGGGSIFFGGDLMVDQAIVDIVGAGKIDFGSAITLRNNSSMDITDLTLGLGRTMEVESGSTLDVATTTVVDSGGSLEIVNATFNSGGDVEIDGGTFRFERNQGLASLLLPAAGTFTARNGAQVEFLGFPTIGFDQTYAFESGTDLMSPNFIHNVGTTFLGSGNVVIDGTDTTFDVGGFIVGTNTTNPSTVTIRNGAVGTLGSLHISPSFSPGNPNSTRGRATLESNASVELTSGILVGTNNGPSGGFGNFVVQTGAALTQTGAGEISIGSESTTTGTMFVRSGASYTSGTGAFEVNDRGTLSITGGSAPGTVEVNGLMDVEGTVFVDDGILHVNAAMTVDGGDVTFNAGEMNVDSIDLINSGTFDFNGGNLSVDVFDGDLVNSGGTLMPGDSAGNTAIVGDYNQQSSAALEIEIGGTGMGTTHDFVQVSGNAILDGELLLSVIDGFVPDTADTFLVLSAADILGVFDNVANGQRLDTFAGGGSFVVNYGIGSAFDPDQIVLSDFQFTGDADFDNDGDIDGTDFLLIQRTNPALIPQWQAQYGNASLAASQTVPEPRGVVLLSMVAIYLHLRRRIV